MKTTMNTILVAAISMASLAAGALLDGPSDHEADLSTQADIAHAKAAAREAAILQARCHATRGPSADLVMVGTNGDYACRVMDK